MVHDAKSVTGAVTVGESGTLGFSVAHWFSPDSDRRYMGLTHLIAVLKALKPIVSGIPSVGGPISAIIEISMAICERIEVRAQCELSCFPHADLLNSAGER